jgi:hypothetical protein
MERVMRKRAMELMEQKGACVGIPCHECPLQGGTCMEHSPGFFHELPGSLTMSHRISTLASMIGEKVYE